ncbi:hypothetical protein C672_0581 [[Clostridium] bifermentans ATCC 638]|uniref:Uncharacterized protein n=1 Tax=Paraclostridium bifermentans ATCC 638 = DSM 14991 TaxID=1233171 RepID=T4VRC6_PARBF|nr:hypothetical protein [Paraclostridium bifermentans]EQK44053.1 hypothetical protein C672_0581 [[Clostridium] bifermentans ATCC 638] [Paraclostridium bifermentans ATCC 638 = DSM 14991]RIZ58542.1 hypothetical protein CHH45_10555 [Paraclostridium bifermentans]UAG19793.1 hypothetical protein KXZ80_16650 [Paraclostridium bifermentans]
MKKFLKYSISIMLFLATLLYLFCTPIGSLRLAVLKHGYPINALNMSVSIASYKQPNDIKKNQTMYTINNPPIESSTQTSLENWIISKYGPLYIGEYFGY